MKQLLLITLFFASISFSYSQNVGIGTTNPIYARLQVVGTFGAVFPSTNAAFNAGTSAALIRGNDTYSFATTPDYTWYNSDQTGLFHPSSATIGFATNGFGEVMRISNDRLGIGTNSPGSRLELNGAITYTPSTINIAVSSILTPGNNGYVRLNPTVTSLSITGFSSTGAAVGQMVIIENLSTVFPITIQSGTGAKLNGSVSYIMGLSDTLTLIYDGNIWVEVGRSNN